MQQWAGGRARAGMSVRSVFEWSLNRCRSRQKDGAELAFCTELSHNGTIATENADEMYPHPLPGSSRSLHHPFLERCRIRFVPHTLMAGRMG